MAGKVGDALLGLTQYLQGENQRLDIEEKEKKIELVAEHVADKFQDLGPDATLQEIQGLQFELIEDAAALGGLQENLPLISGLMQSTMNTRQMQKLEDEDTALNKFIREKYGITGGEGLSGQQIGALAHQFKGYEKDVLVKAEDQTITLKTFDMDRQEVFSLKVDSFGTPQQMDIFKQQAGYKHGLAVDLLNRRTAAQIKIAKDKATGMKWIQGKQGPLGENLWTDGNGMGLYTQDQLGRMVAWDQDRGTIVSRGTGTQGMDVLKGMGEAKSFYGGERYQSASALAGLEGGEQLIKDITGLDDITVTNKMNEEVLSSATMERLDQFFAKDADTINKRLQEVGVEEGSPEREELDLIQGFYKSETTFNQMLLQDIPKTYRDDLIDVKKHNEGTNGIRNIMEDPNADERAKRYVSNYIGNLGGMPPGSQISMGDFGALEYYQRKPLIDAISNNTNYITIPVGDPFMETKKDFKTPGEVKQETEQKEKAIRDNIRKNLDLTDMPAHYLRTKF